MEYKLRIAIFLLLAVVLGGLNQPTNTLAHPLGNFTVNRYSRLDVGSEGIKILYVLDMAEIPTVQERQTIDSNNDRQVSEAERLNYLERKAKEIQNQIKLLINNAPVELVMGEKMLNFPAGQGGLDTLRLTIRFVTAPLPGNANNLFYQDNNYADRQGWKEMVVRNANGVAIEKSSAPDTDQSNTLLTYPERLLSSPLALTSAQVTFRLDSSVRVASPDGSTENTKPTDPISSLVNTKDFSFWIILTSLLGALGLGVFHSLSPGHGKTIVAAYLIGSRSTALHAVFLGLVVTATHTIGVFALGLITLFASQYILPERLYPWLGFASGLIVVIMGVTLFQSRLRSARAKPSFLHGSHSHDHDRSNQQHSHPHSPDHSEKHAHGEVVHDHAQPHSHHEHSDHSHLPPGIDGTAVTWRKLLLFGISAGLLPCPSALIIMLSTIALGQVVFGIVLVIFFSLGLAGALTIIGLLLIYARKFVEKLSSGKMNRIMRVLPVVGAFVVILVGGAITYEAIIQTGIFSR